MTIDTLQLTNLRNRLIDLSQRNNLLNYRDTQKTVRIIKQDIPSLYEKLIEEESSLTLLPENDVLSVSESSSEVLEQIQSKDIDDSHLILETQHTTSDLRKRLHQLQAKSKTAIEEQGYSILYLALGFIQWSEQKDAECAKAPLLLIPVELTRQNVKSNYTISWTGDEPIVSPSLMMKCKQFNLALPEYSTRKSFQSFISEVSEVLNRLEWGYIPEATLDLFSFKKLLMFNDLDTETWSEEQRENPILQSIFNPSEAPPTGSLPDRENMDEWLKSNDTYTILDADSSQLEVIEAAKRGMNLVVEGPPGTGKSQTIVNLIAELLAMEKTVLFVSEKMAALDVVKRRLDASGLSSFCLELHSQKVRKRAFLKELEQSVHHTPAKDCYNENDIAYTDTLKTEINEYCKSLSGKIGNSGYSTYDLIGLRELYVPYSKIQVYDTVSIPDVLDISYPVHLKTMEVLKNIVLILEDVVPGTGNLTSYPWLGTHPKPILPPEQRKIDSLLSEYINLSEKLESIWDTEALPFPKTYLDLLAYTAVLWAHLQGIKLDSDVVTSPLWDNSARVSDFIADVEILEKNHRTLRSLFTQEIISSSPRNYIGQLEDYVDATDGWKAESSNYKSFKANIGRHYYGDISDDKTLLKHLKYVEIFQNSLHTFKNKHTLYIPLYRQVFAETEINLQKVRDYTNYIFALRNACFGINAGTELQNLLRTVYGGRDHLSWGKEAIQISSCLQNLRDDLTERLGISQEILSADLERFTAYVRKWKDSIAALGKWSRFLTLTDQCQETPAKNLLPLIFEGTIATEMIVPTYVANYTDLLLAEAYKTHPGLATFSPLTHERTITEFIKSDENVISSNAARVRTILEKRIPNIDNGANGDHELSVLLGEFSRKSGHMSVRTLMREAGGFIQKIKPCFMMSPLSVAQYLDKSAVKFDVVIFDEASQVKPEDAFSALLRGKQLIVMGDSNQLPPTSFFDNIIYDEERDDVVAEIQDMESLLHLCKKVYPIKRLRWHYRSQHESLIAFSNQEFYDGTLQVFPSPKHRVSAFGLEYVHLRNTEYGRGTTRVNLGEAQAIAQAVITHYREHPEKTLGVATFSMKQQEAILLEIETLLRENPDIEYTMYRNISEPFFVKNIETLQGDERDVIFISIGYGYDENHTLTQSFGPLNLPEGYRRLNVLITRARERCVLYANFRGSDIHVTEHTPTGVKALSRLLTYAETRKLPSSAEETPGTKDYFTEALSNFLRENNYETDLQVGCAGFRVDIGVVNPEKPTEYLAGIVCDGDNYCSSTIARDRDRLRPVQLKKLGWNIIHVWSSAWYLNPEETMHALLSELSSLMGDSNSDGILENEETSDL